MKLISKIVLVSVLITTLLFTPYSLNINSNTSNAETTDELKPQKKVTIISGSKDIQKVMENIKTKKNDESLKKARKNISENKLNVNSINPANSKTQTTALTSAQKSADSTTLAVNIKDLRNNENLQKQLHLALEKGKYIYIYGETKRMEAKNLLKLEEFKVPLTVNGKTIEKKIVSDKEITKIKGTKKKTNREFNEKDTISIIGYTLKNDSIYPYTEINVSSYDNKGKKRKNTEESYIQEIIDHQSKIVDTMKRENEIEATSFISKNKASADIVKAKYGYTASVYDSRDLKAGTVTTDYKLIKSSDSDATYDFFSLKPTSQMTEYNGSASREIKVDIDIPYDPDHLDDWSPYNNESGPSQNLQLVAPFALTWSMTWDDSVDIEDLSSRSLDYARWKVKDGDLNGQDFRPGAGWASAGTAAVSDLRVWGTFYVGSSNQYPVNTYQKIHVAYDY